MSPQPGDKLGHFEILALIGVGGMGEVYRAADRKLNRDVALKFLPAQFTSDRDRMERFQREAHVLASLNHPNIAAIYGVEDWPPLRALVMELVEGPTLADRIGQGPVPVEEVLPIAKQIAEALEYAHERGVVHRDLKPANIKLTPEGQVKVLDFGLAKAMSGEAPAATLSNSPTLSLAGTQAGVILGTAAYMSPEQAKGKTVDRRADIWAFGVVVFEMLTGRMLFSGETASETMAQVMMKEPAWDALPPATPSRLRELLHRCLVKGPRNRLRDIGDARIAIEEIIAHPETETAPPLLSRWRRALPWTAAIGALAIGAILAWAPWRTTPQPEVMRLSMELGVDASLNTAFGAAAILSPDGKALAFVANASGQSRLYVRRLDQLKASPLAGTDGARNPFFSPDGQWIGFFAGGKLKKISITGGAAVTLCDAPNDRGGSWAADGSIVLEASNTEGLSRVSSTGGTPEPLTKLDQGEATHRWPQVLPGGQAVLFTVSTDINNFEDANIVVQSLRSGETKVVQRGGYHARYVPSGHLVYMHQATLFVAPFDLDRLEITAQPVPVLESVTTVPNTGGSQFAFSESGALVYLAGPSGEERVSVYWMSRDGKTQPLRAAIAYYANIRFSPDGRRLAMNINDQQFDLWVYEWERDTMSRLTFDPVTDQRPAWTPDGRRIAFGSERGNNASNLYWQRTDGTGEPQRLTESKNSQRPASWHPSGKFLAFTEIQPQTSYDIMILPVDGDETSGWKPGKPIVFLASSFQEQEPAFSPDGRWLAYQSNESGRNEVYVRPFPGPGGKWQISTAGGVLPTWSRNGKELFYRTDDSRIMVASYKVEGDSFRAEKPQSWSEGQFTDRAGNRNFDLHPDGQRFAVLKTPESQTETKVDKVTLILNFSDELRRIAPTGKR